MKKIYLDSEFRCHTEPGEGREAFETEAFDGYTDAYIKGCRLVPAGKTWTRQDGETFRGEMISPAIPYDILRSIQKESEAFAAKEAEQKEALRILGVTV